MTAEPAPGRRLGLRWQATLLIVAAVGLTMVTAAIALVVVAERRLEASIEATAVARAEGVAAIAAADAVTDPLPGRDPEVITQIVAADGALMAADRSALGLPPLFAITVLPGERRVVRTTLLAEGIEPEVDVEDDGPFVVVAEGVTVDAAPAMVLVATSLEDAVATRRTLIPLLGVGLPVVLAIVGLVGWRITGRALRPVEAMRRQAEQISLLALHRRLPVPGAQDELTRLATTLNDMLDRLERSALRQRQFVGDASHELKSPLAALRTMVDVADRNPEGHVTAEFVADLGDEIARMERLVADLLVLARTDEATPPPVEPVDLGETAAAAAGTVPAGGSVTVDSRGLRTLLVLAERTATARAVGNVVDNAMRHAATTVWLEVDDGAEGGVLWVSDDGPGVEAADAERIFERFVRLDGSRARHTGGTGLGLAVARAVARSFGGDVRLGAPRHGGASFAIVLPPADRG